MSSPTSKPCSQLPNFNQRQLVVKAGKKSGTDLALGEELSPGLATPDRRLREPMLWGGEEEGTGEAVEATYVLAIGRVRRENTQGGSKQKGWLG